MNTFTPHSLPEAVRALFELNNYTVEGPKEIHGAEIDLIATPKSDPFASSVYIEVTVEYVDTEKYGKDLTKLSMVRELDPTSHRLIVSSEGFSVPVRERAAVAGIKTLTYTELFARFERFEPYVKAVTSHEHQLGGELMHLNSIYEEPNFQDALGSERATEYLSEWRLTDTQRRWLVLVGEYGTGKTALTKILQYRWTVDYQRHAGFPIPFRIELRDFTRQFDARGLLHHFLDKNQLGHVPIDFVFSLIRSGRIVLLLDGYDEMAQYMHARERRACLEALAQLAADGARGVLTSRPNYFTQLEELQVLEHLYASLKSDALSVAEREIADREQAVDRLFEAHILSRHERALKDLDPEQTESLVSRVLADDPEGRDAVLNVTRRVFREVESGATVALSGKPVIISYLLEVVEGLKVGRATEASRLTEWQVYKLILDQLMLRDYKQSPHLLPARRRAVLHTLSEYLSKRHTPVITETEFREIVRREFRNELRSIDQEQREEYVERHFADLRRSTTLTRGAIGHESGWRFSHNSLREFLLTEFLSDRLLAGTPHMGSVPISDAMRLFAASRPAADRVRILGMLRQLWPERANLITLGSMLSLYWDGLWGVATPPDEMIAAHELLRLVTGTPANASKTSLSGIRVSSEIQPAELTAAEFAECELLDIDFSFANLKRASFRGSLLQGVRFTRANLSETNFSEAVLEDVELSGAILKGANFLKVADSTPTIIVESAGADTGRERFEGKYAIGYLRFHGAVTDEVPTHFVLRHHAKYAIVDKIIRRLSEQAVRQRRGLVQRGAAQRDTRFAGRFVKHLFAQGYVQQPKNRTDLLEVTDVGREVFTRMIEQRDVPADISDFLLNN